MQNGRKKRGFTLVELLVVIAIIGILVALLLPAIQAAREAARRSSCQNKMKQIGLGLMNYESTYNVFPPGVLLYGSGATNTPPTPPSGGTAETGASWLVMLLPFVEQQSLWEQFNCGQRFIGRFNINFATPNANGQANGQLPQFTVLPLVRCPSNNSGGPASVRTDYAGCMGGGCDTRLGANCGLPASMDAQCDSGTGRLWFTNGIFFQNRSIPLADVQDGASNTYLVGETRLMRTPEDVGTGLNYGSWACGADLRTAAASSSLQTMTAASLPINHPLSLPTASEWAMRTFSSHHPGGCHMMMADASVHFVGDNIELNIHRVLGSRKDKLPAHLP